MLDGAGAVAEVVDDANVDPLLSAEQQANLTKLALKRKIEEAAKIDVISKDLPPKLRIKPDDSEDVVRAAYFINYVIYELNGSPCSQALSVINVQTSSFKDP